MPNRHDPKVGVNHDSPCSGTIAYCCEFLESAIRAGEFDASPRLPSIADLARSAGVSRFTMWKAVLALKKDGRITGDRPAR